MKKDESIRLISVQRLKMLELVGLISNPTEHLKIFITEYFKEMQEKKKMVELNAYAQLYPSLCGYYLQLKNSDAIVRCTCLFT